MSAVQHTISRLGKQWEILLPFRKGEPPPLPLPLMCGCEKKRSFCVQLMKAALSYSAADDGDDSAHCTEKEKEEIACSRTPRLPAEKKHCAKKVRAFQRQRQMFTHFPHRTTLRKKMCFFFAVFVREIGRCGGFEFPPPPFLPPAQLKNIVFPSSLAQLESKL